MAILTISRQIGSMGDEIAQTLADRMGWALLNRDIMLDRVFSSVCDETEMYRLRESAKFFLNQRKDNPKETYLDYLTDHLLSLAARSRLFLWDLVRKFSLVIMKKPACKTNGSG
jgi:hypothetical protein